MNLPGEPPTDDLDADFYTRDTIPEICIWRAPTDQDLVATAATRAAEDELRRFLLEDIPDLVSDDEDL